MRGPRSVVSVFTPPVPPTFREASTVVVGCMDYRRGSDPVGFRNRMLRAVPSINTFAEQCAMAGEVRTFRFGESTRRDFAELSRFPAGLVVVGNAVAAVNPIYGQGPATPTRTTASPAGFTTTATPTRACGPTKPAASPSRPRDDPGTSGTLNSCREQVPCADRCSAASSRHGRVRARLLPTGRGPGPVLVQSPY